MHGYKIVDPDGTLIAQAVIHEDKVEIGLYGEKHYLARTFEPREALKFCSMIWDVSNQLLAAVEEKDTTGHGEAQ